MTIMLKERIWTPLRGREARRLGSSALLIFCIIVLLGLQLFISGISMSFRLKRDHSSKFLGLPCLSMRDSSLQGNKILLFCWDGSCLHTLLPKRSWTWGFAKWAKESEFGSPTVLWDSSIIWEIWSSFFFLLLISQDGYNCSWLNQLSRSESTAFSLWICVFFILPFRWRPTTNLYIFC